MIPPRNPRWIVHFTSIAAALFIGIGGAMGQDHGHLYISAYSKSPGSQLYFDNGASFEEPSGYVKTLVLNSNSASRYVGRYDGNITLTPRSTDAARGDDYGVNAAAPGSVVCIEFLHVSGPTGGAFEFWENTGTTPLLSIPTGTGLTNLVKASQSTGAPGDDPWGHIHGRRFTATVAGLYRVRLRAVEISTNGPSGGPIHVPSAPLTITFQAGFVIDSVRRTNAMTTVRIGTAITHDFTLQATTNLVPPVQWFNVGARVRGSDHFHSMQDIDATNGLRFYRVLAEPFIP